MMQFDGDPLLDFLRQQHEYRAEVRELMKSNETDTAPARVDMGDLQQRIERAQWVEDAIRRAELKNRIEALQRRQLE